MTERKVELDKLDLERIGRTAGRAFSGQSDTYKQKLVYSLLNTIKSEDKDEFMAILLRSVNAKKGNVPDFMDELRKIQDNMRTKEFSDIAQAIVIGIMSSYDKNKENIQEE